MSTEEMLSVEKQDRDRIAAIEAQLVDGSKRMDRMQEELTSNTEVTREIRDILAMGRTGLKVLGGLGTFAKWLGGIAGACAAIWSFFYMLTHGGPPNK